VAATSHNEFFRDMIMTALAGLIGYDADVKILRVPDLTNLPTAGIRVYNEKFDFEPLMESQQTYLTGTLDIEIIIYFKVAASTDSPQVIEETGDMWFEWVELLLKQIDFTAEYTQITNGVTLYRVAAEDIRILGNYRDGTRRDQLEGGIEISGQLLFEKQYL